MEHAKYFAPLDPVATSVVHPPASESHGSHTITSQPAWAGHWIPQNACSTNGAFTWTVSDWIQPSVPGDSSYPDSSWQSAPAASFWNGIGGIHSGNLIQAGADSIATKDPEYRFWTEDYPLGSIYEGPVISPGQEAYVYVEYGGNNTTYFFLENMTTSQYQSFTNSTPYVDTSTAEFINEKLGSYLPNFGKNVPYDGSEYGNGTYTYQLYPCYNTYWMEDNSNYIMSEPTEADSSDDFTNNWYRSN